MNQETQPPTEPPVSYNSQPSTPSPHVVPDSETSNSSINATIKGPSTKPPSIREALAAPFAISHNTFANLSPDTVRWLWPERIPRAGITLLEGAHGCYKSTLALQIAAHISRGTPLPDGSLTIPGGVVIVTPYIDASTLQLPRLIAWGAGLSRIQILTYVHDPKTASHSSGYRPFYFPQDLPRLLNAIDSVKAHLIILAPFTSTLSYDRRWTNQRFADLLAELNQHFITRNIACLLTRDCRTKGSQEILSRLERSEHFLSIAVSHLHLTHEQIPFNQRLLAREPIQPKLLLSHISSAHGPLAPTLILQIQSQPYNSNTNVPFITVQSVHSP